MRHHGWAVFVEDLSQDRERPCWIIVHKRSSIAELRVFPMGSIGQTEDLRVCRELEIIVRLKHDMDLSYLDRHGNQIATLQMQSKFSGTLSLLTTPQLTG